MVTTYRHDELGVRHPLREFLAELGRLPMVTRLELGPLSRPETAALFAQVRGRDPLPSAVDRIQRRSGGIPFYIEELAALAEADTALPATLRDALQVRFRQLSDTAQDTVRLATVIGNRAAHDLLAGLSEHTERELERGLREIVDCGLLVVEGDGYAFRHALLREAIEADLLPGERRRLHRRAASTLEATPGGELASHAIALHWLAGRDWERAFEWSVRAARSSTAAPGEALQMYEHILELWDLVEDPSAVAGSKATLLEAAARTARDAGEYERSAELVTLALEASQEDDFAGRFARLMLRLQLRIDLIQPGVDEEAAQAKRLLSLIEEPRMRASALEQLAAYRLNNIQDGRLAGREAVAAAVALKDPVSESQARNTLGTMLLATERSRRVWRSSSVPANWLARMAELGCGSQ